MKDGQLGFCKVRGNRDGRLVTYNYGKGVHVTEEVIETEAVFHFSPGSRILSLGNIGCMFNCSYCQNWKTSQARYVDDRDVYRYTPEEIVDKAVRHGIRVLSWTYNDPVVWHEFVRDTSRLARQAGLKNLYKSAFYISEEAVDELLPSIDIFSISLKAIDEEYYRRITTGRMQPVLDATKKVYRANKHVEISMLMITDISDSEEDARKMAGWMLDNLGPEVPLHFVRFHPDYKMRDTVRTPVDRLRRAREVALDMGMQHVYLGNVLDPEAQNTTCRGCEEILVERFGLAARVVGLTPQGHCRRCGNDAHFAEVFHESEAATVDQLQQSLVVRSFDWHGDIASLHVQVRNPTDSPQSIYHRWRNGTEKSIPWRIVTLNPNESYRILLSKSQIGEVGRDVALHPLLESNLHEVFDRAHFPTVSVDSERAETDISPLPLYPGRQLAPEKLQKKLHVIPPAQTVKAG